VPPIPFTVIGGFLGAGKTTLLNRWLSHADGQRIAVLVNDFGAINIDAGLIAHSGADTIALTNGCVCCSIGDDLTQALLRVLSSEPPFDAVVVEASGVSDPWRIAQFAIADPRLLLDGVIVLLDASCALDQAVDPLLKESIERPLAHADLVVLNKSDLVDAVTLDKLRDWVGQHAPQVPVIAAVHADLPLALLGSAGLYRAHGGGLKSLPALHATQFDTWSVQARGIYDAALLRAWLHDLPPGVLRMKGWLQSGDTSWLELQFAGRRTSLQRAAPPPNGAQALVAIGLAGQLPSQELEEGLARCSAIKT